MHGLFGREPINFRRPKWTASFFPVLVREFLHQFVTILAIKIGQGLGSLHAVFASGLFSHGLRRQLELRCYTHTPLVFARLTLKSFTPFDLTDCLQVAAFV